MCVPTAQVDAQSAERGLPELGFIKRSGPPARPIAEGDRPGSCRKEEALRCSRPGRVSQPVKGSIKATSGVVPRPRFLCPPLVPHGNQLGLSVKEEALRCSRAGRTLLQATGSAKATSCAAAVPPSLGRRYRLVCQVVFPSVGKLKVVYKQASGRSSCRRESWVCGAFHNQPAGHSTSRWEWNHPSSQEWTWQPVGAEAKGAARHGAARHGAVRRGAERHVSQRSPVPDIPQNWLRAPYL